MCRKALLGAVLALCLSDGAAFAQTTTSWSVGIEGHYQSYEEPSLAVEMTGPFLGGTLEGRLQSDQWMLRGDGRIAVGLMDYSSRDTGSDDGVLNYVFEGRIVAGRTLPFSTELSLTPYIGYGYRSLYDDGGGRRTTTGHVGYDRWSQYHYIPIGLEGDVALSPAWRMTPAIEYDHLIVGYQNSYLSDVQGFGDIENEQDSGYGLRASVMFGTTWDGRPIEFGPYVRYWNIEDSDLQPLIRNGTQIGFGYEPANETIEAGVGFKMKF